MFSYNYLEALPSAGWIASPNISNTFIKPSGAPSSLAKTFTSYLADVSELLCDVFLLDTEPWNLTFAPQPDQLASTDAFWEFKCSFIYNGTTFKY